MKREFPDFEPFPRDMDIIDPQFRAYKESIGIQSNLVELVEPLRAREATANVIDAATEIAHPMQECLHSAVELEVLYEVAFGLHDHIPQPNGHIVNCGTFRAANACVVATALRDSSSPTPMITIDPFTYAHKDSNENDTTDLVFVHHKQLIEKLGLQDLIVSVFYKDIEYILQFWSDQLIRIAIIDTVHSYEQTKNEIQLLTKYIPRGGWFISHDYMPAFPGVLRAIHEFLAHTPRQYRLLNRWAYLFIQFLT